MIKIIKGTYGRRDGPKIVPVTSASPAFELDPKKEDRLVNLGVAKYVTAPEAEDAAAVQKPAAGKTGVGGNGDDYSLDMKLAELKDIAAKKYGVDAEDLRKAQSKAKVIELIEATKAKDQNPPAPTRIIDLIEATKATDLNPPALPTNQPPAPTNDPNGATPFTEGGKVAGAGRDEKEGGASDEEGTDAGGDEVVPEPPKLKPTDPA